jgi:hypothetical protein
MKNTRKRNTKEAKEVTRPGKNTPGPHVIEHPEKDPQSGKRQKGLAGFFGTRK